MVSLGEQEKKMKKEKREKGKVDGVIFLTIYKDLCGRIRYFFALRGTRTK